MENENEYKQEMTRYWERAHRRGKFAGGLLVVVAGVLFLARELGAELPHWLFSWKMILIGVGVVMLIKHGFSRAGGVIAILIGGAFLLSDLYPEFALKPILWPSLLIVIGLFIMFKPRRNYKHLHAERCHSRHWRQETMFQQEANTSREDFIDSTSVMGGTKRIILTKNFKGGDITNVFGGSEINLMQADFEGKVKLEVTQIFGGTKLIIPTNWQLQTAEFVTVFGSIEDRRPVIQQAATDESKILILTGVTVFGGISISSY